MKEQNYRNHTRYVPGFHFVTSVAMLALLIGSFINLAHSAKENLYSASLICLVSVIFCFLFWYTRSFALRAQDRAIRAEENFRHFILTGKPLPAGIRMSQTIALRFASDAELPALAERAVKENLKNSEIKQAIVNWRADHHRV
ncbi:MAG: hypothetical protein HYU71_02860 [Bacteroidetes bacterium]|nr:hypothetical protein [Bacteroidota bacterium]